jgi:two-component system heavy metal sensor histidine kinase CusS
MYSTITKAFRLDSLSLANRLMLLYTLSTLGILAAICLFLYPIFMKMMLHFNGAHAMRAECYRSIILALLVSSFSAVTLGRMVAQNGIKRIQEFSEKIEKITVHSLSERINLADWPSELKGVGVKFNLMLDRLQTSFDQLSQFSSDIAHELRNPLNNLRGSTELMLRKEKLPEEYIQVLEANMSEYHHLSKLVENLLFLARSDHGQVRLEKQMLDAGTEISKIIAYYQGLLDEKKITLHLEGDGFVSVDTTLFKRIINNLLSNAIKYTPPQGKIKLKIKTLTKGWTEIAVEDSGIGIESSHLPKIFDRFYRVDSSRCVNSGGLGLGLALVKSIVDLHKGKVRIESQAQVGTTVYLELPSRA